MMVLIRFWRSLTKKDSVKSARYDTGITFFFYSNSSFGTFFTRIRILVRIFPDRIRNTGLFSVICLKRDVKSHYI